MTTNRQDTFSTYQELRRQPTQWTFTTDDEHSRLGAYVPASIKKQWAKLGITWRMYQNMFKGALAPTIAIAAYQATAWAEHYTTIGYLIGVASVLSLVIQPRAKFLQTMLIQIFCSTMGCCIALLACYCTVQARLHSVGFDGAGTGGPGTSGTAAKGAQTAGYNSSASAVAGVWLFAEIFVISAVRAKLPQWTAPCVLWSIFANISMTYAPQFNTMAQATAFARRMYGAQLTGFGLATGVSLVIFPLTSRQVVFDDMKGFFTSLRAVLDANMVYMQSLEDTDMFAAQRTNTEGEKPLRSPEAQALREKTQALTAALAKVHTNLPFAKREIAVGKIGPDDLKAAFKRYREITIPTVGLNMMSDMFDRISEERGFDRSVSFAHANADETLEGNDKLRVVALNEWHELISLLRDPFGSITEVIKQGLQHIELVMRLQKRHRRRKDSEKEGDIPAPGSVDFAQYFDQQSRDFLESKKTMLRGWCKVHGIDLPEDFFSDQEAQNIDAPLWMNSDTMSNERRRKRRQLMIMLYFESLLHTISRKTYEVRCRL